jgi:hypothetical protein
LAHLIQRPSGECVRIRRLVGIDQLQRDTRGISEFRAVRQSVALFHQRV